MVVPIVVAVVIVVVVVAVAFPVAAAVVADAVGHRGGRGRVRPILVRHRLRPTGDARRQQETLFGLGAP